MRGSHAGDRESRDAGRGEKLSGQEKTPCLRSQIYLLQAQRSIMETITITPEFVAIQGYMQAAASDEVDCVIRLSGQALVKAHALMVTLNCAAMAIDSKESFERFRNHIYELTKRLAIACDKLDSVRDEIENQED
jgi:hypothetical protein